MGFHSTLWATRINSYVGACLYMIVEILINVHEEERVKFANQLHKYICLFIITDAPRGGNFFFKTS